MKKIKKSIPNILSSSRIFMLPVLFTKASVDTKGSFLALSIGLLSTDILDGFLARRFNVDSEFGRKIDAVADYLFYSSVVVLSLLILKDSFIRYMPYVLFPTALFFIPKIVGFYFLKKFPTLHLHSWRVAGGFVFFWLFYSIFRQFNITFLVLVSLCCVVACLEESIIYITKRSDLDQEINSIFEIV